MENKFEVSVTDECTKKERVFTVKMKPGANKDDDLPSKRAGYWKARKISTFISLLILLIVPILFLGFKLRDFVSKSPEIEESTTLSATYTPQSEENSKGVSLKKFDVTTTKSYFLIPCIAFLVFM